MKSLKLFETQKLHYGKYLYKLAIMNPLGHAFRNGFQDNGNLTHTKIVIDALTLRYRNGEPLTQQTYRSNVPVSELAYLDAKDVYSILKKHSEYKIRCEGSSMLSIYSNDRDLLMKIANKMRTSLREFWEPKPEAIVLLQRKENIKIVNLPTEFLYQVHLAFKKIDPSIYNWVTSNPGKVKVGQKTLLDFARGVSNGSYIYVRDQRVLMLVELLIGNAIRKVDKLVYKGDIDKYTYDNQ